MDKKETAKIFGIFLSIAVLNFFIFGYLDKAGRRIEGDEIDYNAYAKNIIEHGIYSLDGKNFSAFKEPGYPVFLSVIYKFFGFENVTAVQLAQTVLLAVIALFAYLAFTLFKRRKLGLWAGVLIAANPYYAYFSSRLLTEILFTFFMAAVFYLVLEILKSDKLYFRQLFFLGVVCAAGALVRFQFVYFPLLLIMAGFIFRIKPTVFNFKNTGLFLAGFAVPMMAWVGYCYSQTGKLMIQEGRLELLIYVRAHRAQQSWPELFHYAGLQLQNTFLGKNDPLLWENDTRAITTGYDPALYPYDASIKMIRDNWGKYLFGNSIEYLKLISVSHAFNAPVFNKYIRAGVYLLMYAVFLWGLVVFYKKKNLSEVVILALLFLIYNSFLISFLHAEPRYNVPLHFFYLVIGVTGFMRKTNEDH